MSEGLWSLLGVFVGFTLSEGWSSYKARRTAKSLRRELDQELRAILRMLPFKKSTLEQAQESLSSNQFLSTFSTHFPRVVYDQLILTCSDELNTKERDCLHILYEHLRSLDDHMDDLESRYVAIKQSNSENSALQMASGTLRDLMVNIGTCEKLTTSVLQKNPIAVFGDTDSL